MALKDKKALGAGIQKGLDKERARPARVGIDRFAAADAVLARNPNGLLSGGQPDAGQSFSAERLPGRSIVSIPIDLIDDNPLNARRIYSPKVIQERAASIATHGQKTPVSVIINPDHPGRYILIDGHYRKRGAQACGKRDLDCVVEHIESELDMYRLSWMLNEQRSAQSVLDNAMAWKNMLDEKKVRGEVEIAEITGVSAANINKTLAILDLPEEVISIMTESPEAIGLATGYEIRQHARVAGLQSAIELANKVVNEGLSYRDVVEFRKRIEDPKPRKQKESSRHYKIKSRDGGHVGVIKDFDSGRVVLDVNIKDTREREAVVMELQKRFGLVQE